MSSVVFDVVFSAEKIFFAILADVRLDLEVHTFPVIDESRVGLEG